MSSRKVRFAVIGAGMIGDVHAQALTELSDSAELTVIADIDGSKAAAMAGKYGAGGSTTDVDALLRRPDIDAVIICRPTGQHADLAVSALNAGKHVVIEKPIEVSLAAADRIIAAEQSSGKTVAVMSQHRFDKSTVKVLDAVRAGRLGNITSAIASHAWWRGQSYYDSATWRGTWAMDGGGAAMNQTVHTIDLMVTILGTPVEVFAYTACLAHERIEVEDTATAVVKSSPVRWASSTPPPPLTPAWTPACGSSGQRAPPSSPTTNWCSCTRTPALHRKSPWRPCRPA